MASNTTMYDPLETVNPADLIIPRCEEMAVPPSDTISPLNGSNEMTMAPLWTGDEWNGFVEQSTQQLTSYHETTGSINQARASAERLRVRATELRGAS